MGVPKFWLHGASRDDIHKLVQSLTVVRKNSRNEEKQISGKNLASGACAFLSKTGFNLIESMANPPTFLGRATSHPARWVLSVSGSQINAPNLQIIFLKVGPQKIVVEFLICAGTQVIVNTKKTANIF